MPLSLKTDNKFVKKISDIQSGLYILLTGADFKAFGT